MTGFDFAILFGLSSLLCPGRGRITPPSDGTKLIFISGSTVNITWTFDNVGDVVFRAWFFTSWSKTEEQLLAYIFGDGFPLITNTSSLSEIEIVKPATLILKNVNQHYNGKYRFYLPAQRGGESVVSVLIIEKPNVTLSCSTPIRINEGEDITCLCKAEGVNAPAYVTWYKNGVQLSEIRNGNQSLNLRKINRISGGKYKCVAKSHTLIEEKTIEIIVYYAVPPTVISLGSTPEIAIVKHSIVITCEAIAVPLPSYTIVHNDTEVVSKQKTYIIRSFKNFHAGSYKCIATNYLGNSSKIINLYHAGRTGLQELNRSETEWCIILVILLSGIIIGIFFSCIVFCSRRKCRKTNRQLTAEEQTNEVDTTYEQLDLSKMNTEDNYQSLRKDGVSVYDESTYTKLNRPKDVEDNYQSLT